MRGGKEVALTVIRRNAEKVFVNFEREAHSRSSGALGEAVGQSEGAFGLGTADAAVSEINTTGGDAASYSFKGAGWRRFNVASLLRVHS